VSKFSIPFHVSLLLKRYNGEEALQKCLNEAWQLVILDISMPKLDGLEVLRQAKRERLDLCVLIYSMHISPQHVQKAFKLGARGYLGKSDVADEIGPAIHAILRGETFLSTEVANALTNGK
jgi:two-component system, NarL family, invasion response regulator UvrY